MYNISLTQWHTYHDLFLFWNKIQSEKKQLLNKPNSCLNLIIYLYSNMTKKQKNKTFSRFLFVKSKQHLIIVTVLKQNRLKQPGSAI